MAEIRLSIVRNSIMPALGTIPLMLARRQRQLDAAQSQIALFRTVQAVADGVNPQECVGPGLVEYERGPGRRKYQLVCGNFNSRRHFDRYTADHGDALPPKSTREEAAVGILIAAWRNKKLNQSQARQNESSKTDE